jgi:hypothetical protein
MSSRPIALYRSAWPHTAFPMGWGSRDRWSVLVLIIRVPNGSNISWRTPSLSSEFIWCQSDHVDYVCSHSRVVMSGGDEMNSSTRVPVCQTRMVTCDYVLSWLALNDLVFWGPRLLGHLLDTSNPQVWLSRVQVCAEPRHLEELDQTDMWWYLSHPLSLWGDRRDWCRSFSCLIFLSRWSLPFSQEWYMILQIFGVEGSQIVSRFVRP